MYHHFIFSVLIHVMGSDQYHDSAHVGASRDFHSSNCDSRNFLGRVNLRLLHSPNHMAVQGRRVGFDIACMIAQTINTVYAYWEYQHVHCNLV